MANFCEKCGSPLNSDGKCTNCDNPIHSTPAAPQTNLTDTNNSTKKSKKKSDKAKKSKKAPAIIILILVLIILAVSAVGFLVYRDILDIPFVNDIFISMGLKEEEIAQPSPEEESTENNGTTEETTSGNEEVSMNTSYEITPPDADEYFNNNSKVKSSFDAKTSKDLHSESETYDNLTERGFKENPITSEYSMDGEYYSATEISSYSSTQHPMYQTYYITASGNVWTIFEINGSVVATPLSYNAQSASGVPVMLSETDTITSYDSTTNKFYVNTPNESILTIKKVTRIDAETLEKLTNEEIDKL